VQDGDAEQASRLAEVDQPGDVRTANARLARASRRWSGATARTLPAAAGSTA
jgi:hypothetical protein